jgi:hypothetical protein
VKGNWLIYFMNQQAQKSEPISGLSSEGYDGPGQIQSPPKKK